MRNIGYYLFVKLSPDWSDFYSYQVIRNRISVKKLQSSQHYRLVLRGGGGIDYRLSARFELSVCGCLYLPVICVYACFLSNDEGGGVSVRLFTLSRDREKKSPDWLKLYCWIHNKNQVMKPTKVCWINV